MLNKALTIALIAAAGLSFTACAQRATDLPPGKYEKTSTSKDASGTAYKSSKTTNVTVDEDGDKRAVTETETTKDPKGLFNKSTSTSKTVEKEY